MPSPTLTSTVECLHTCRDQCAMLNQALHEETGLVRFYESVLKQCDYPEVRGLFEELARERSRSAIRILQKLNELRARAETQDDVMSSFGGER